MSLQAYWYHEITFIASKSYFEKSSSLTLMPSMLGFATNFDPIITGSFSQQEPSDAYAPLSFKRVRNRPPMKPVTGD